MGKEQDTIHRANETVFKAETAYLNKLGQSTKSGSLEDIAKVIPAIDQELKRLDPRGKFDEEEHIIAMLEEKKKKK